MTYSLRYSVPDVVQVGFSATLKASVYDADGAAVTPTAGTLTLFDGSTKLLEDETVTSLAAPTSHTIADSATTDFALSDRGLAVWSLTIGGVVMPFRRPVYIVRQAFHPTITDLDLTHRDSDTLNILPPGTTSARQYREDGRARIEKDLILRGRRPHLIFDAWMLRDAHLAISLHFLYRDAAVKFSEDSRYADEATAYLDEYNAEMEKLSFRYDSDDTGTISTNDTTSAAGGPIMVTAGPPIRSYWRRGY